MAEGLVAGGRCHLDADQANAAWRAENFPRFVQQGSCTYMASASAGGTSGEFTISYASMATGCPALPAQAVPLVLPECDRATFRQSALDLTPEEGVLVSGAVASVLIAAWAIRSIRLVIGRTEVLD